jgi:hypothetical protein
MPSTAASAARSQSLAASLCPELQVILDAELRAGNYVAESWDVGGCVVLLGRPFQVAQGLLSTALTYLETGDSPYWKAEIFEQGTGQRLACRY